MKKILFLLIIPSLSFGQIVTEDCSSIPDPGPCFGCGFIYWFNPATSQCEESCWGLCDGLVPFWTLEDCQNSCENITFIKEAKDWEGAITKINNAKEYDIDSNFIDIAINELPNDPFDEKTWDHWTAKINSKTGFKGKDLFMPLRLILTGKSHGPELKYLMPLFNRNEILQKLGKI